MTPRQPAAALLLAPIVLALASAFPIAATAQTSNDELLKELRALKEKVAELEKKLDTKPSSPASGERQWGMTPEQQTELNRITMKTEALEDSTEANGFKMLKVSGFMDPTVISNRAQRSTGFRFLNNFASADGNGEAYTYDNSYFGMLGLDLQKELEGGTRWRFTLVPHKSTGSNYNYPSIVHEASISVPLTDLQTRFWAGQLPDWSGYEYFFPNQNKFITHNLLFDFAAPTYYTGVGLDILRGKWQTKAVIGNMNISRYTENRRTPVFSYRVDYSKGEFNGFGFAGQHGKVDSLVTGKAERLNMLEVDGYFIRGDLTAQGQVAVGRQARSASNGGEARWWGTSMLGAYKVTPRFEISGRLDYLNNQKNGGSTLNAVASTDSTGAVVGPDGANGIGPGMSYDSASGTWAIADINRGANRWALALGANYLVNLNTTFKVELRFDHADQNVFWYVGDDTYRRGNTVFGSSVVVSF